VGVVVGERVGLRENVLRGVGRAWGDDEKVRKWEMSERRMVGRVGFMS
jgi:hypothetical protein